MTVGRRDPLGWIDELATRRDAAGLRRRLRPRAPDDDTIDLAGNDYLGLARHPRVVAAAADALREWGAGSTGSRLVTGSTTLHAELEAALAGCTGAEAALVFSSGYLANLTAVTVLAGSGDLVVSDAYNHASIVDACRLSRARICVVPHRDVDAVEAALAGREEERALVVTDGVFSVDGDLAPLGALHETCRRHGAVLLVDEAHALGVVGAGGRGAAYFAGLAGAADVVCTATLSKSLGSQGGVLLGPARVIDHAIDAGRGFIFDTGLAPSCAAAALAALRTVEGSGLPADVRRVAIAVARVVRGAGLVAAEPDAAVIGIRLPSPQAAVAAARCCARHGVRVGCFRPPSVPDGISRLRLTARAGLPTAALDRLGAALQEVAHSLDEEGGGQMISPGASVVASYGGSSGTAHPI